ncbi:MAG: F0F1 ATP synthase subunit epsilon [Anaerolineae bacterium]|nr:F0F1 ATP synthase subunit epsilon [Anaerolineae bacterium]MDW8069271.1 F0F1 ATP synthase subunit epsilon [Anaerolineae bacterium]
MGFRLEVVTPEKQLFSGDVDAVLAPGAEGQLGILPRHAPLMSILTEGELVARRGEEELSFAIYGGFIQVLPDRVIVLADVGERADEVDAEQAERARREAEALLQKEPSPALRAEALMALRKAQLRLRVAQRHRPRRPAGEAS